MIYSMILLLFPALLYAQSSLNTYEFHSTQVKNAERGQERLQKLDKMILAIRGGLPLPKGMSVLDVAKQRAAECAYDRPGCLDITRLNYWMCAGNIDSDFTDALLEGLFLAPRNVTEADQIFKQLRTCSQQQKPYKLGVLLKALVILEKKWPKLATQEVGRLVGEWRTPPRKEDLKPVLIYFGKLMSAIYEIKPLPLKDAIVLSKWSLTVMNFGVLADSPSGDLKSWLNKSAAYLFAANDVTDYESVVGALPLATMAQGDMEWWIKTVALLCKSWRTNRTPEKCKAKWSELEQAASTNLTKDIKNRIALEKAVETYFSGQLDPAAKEMEAFINSPPKIKARVELYLGLIKYAQGNLPGALTHIETNLTLMSKENLRPWLEGYSKVIRAGILCEMKNYSKAHEEAEKLRREVVADVRDPSALLAELDFTRLMIGISEKGKSFNSDAIWAQILTTVAAAPGVKYIEHLAAALIAAGKGGDYKPFLAQAEKILGPSNPDFVRAQRVILSVAGAKATTSR